MSDLFYIYEDNIKTLFQKISRILDSIPLQSTEKVDLVIMESESHLKEAERLVKFLLILG
jgi:hypothetical protein